MVVFSHRNGAIGVSNAGLILVQVALLLSCLLIQTYGLPADARERSQPGRKGSNIVDLGYATYQGETLESWGVNQFLGMRFAAPPLGDLRFRAPQPPQNVSGIQNATNFQPICVGNSETVTSDRAEDCLYINVFAPSNATPESKFKVWFYIQGGGYASNSNSNYNGTNVVAKSHHNIILVNFNYRVGALGFLASKKVEKDGALNAGLLDQRFALEWVQKYIHLFGGDPNHVVIHGTSAGGGSVAHQMAAYGGRNDHLFVGAIPQSPFFPTHRTISQSESQFDLFAHATGCGDAGTTVMSCLRSQNISTIQAANIKEPLPGGTGDPLWYFTPVIDGDFSRDYLYTQFERGEFVQVPTMVATCSDEGTYFAANASSPEEVSVFLNNNYPLLEGKQLAEINKLYPRMPPLPEHAAYFPSASAIYGNNTFTCPGKYVNQAVAKYLSPESSWLYRYNVQDPTLEAEGLGVAHAVDVPAIFGVGFAGGEGTSLEGADASVVPVVMDYYLSFVQTLDPNPLKNSTAPVFEPIYAANGYESQQRLKIQTVGSAMEAIPQPHLDRCDYWKSIYRIMQQ